MKNIIVVPLGRHINPLTDFGFKRIFYPEAQKDLLIASLDALFQGQKKSSTWYTTRRKIMVWPGITVKTGAATATLKLLPT